MATIKEDNGDARAHSGTQYTMSVGDVFQGTMETFGEDFIRVELTAGTLYRIPRSAVAAEVGVVDLEGNYIKYKYGGAVGTFMAEVSGTHYIRSYGQLTAPIDYELTIVENTIPPGTYDEIADQLTIGYWEWAGAGTHAFDVATGGVLTANITALTEDGQQLARWALEAWTDVTGIEFQLVDDVEADITFDDDKDGGFNSSSIVNGVTITSHVNVSEDSLDRYGVTMDSRSMSTYIHEIGHALGLGHPNNVSGTYSRAEERLFLNDNNQTSVMSYYNQDRDTSFFYATRATPVTPMIADIIAVHNLYGAPTDIRTGDTVYGYQSNVDGYLGEFFETWAVGGEDSFRFRVALTLYDNGGNDTLDLRTDVYDQRVDLRPEGISDVYKLVGNLVIARDTFIENFIAGSGNDEIIGNSTANRLVGGDGDDWLLGNAGNDVLEGGAGMDTASYQGSDAGVIVKLKDGTGTGGHAEGDTLSGIEHLIGSGHADIFGGDNLDNRLSGMDGDDAIWGGNGDDLLEGGAGADRLNGGTGEDTASYAASDAGVVVRLHSWTAQGGHAEGDTFIGTVTVQNTEVPDIEHLTGSSYADTLAGDLRDNIINGRAGADTLYGGPGGGDDSMYGGNGDDRMFGGMGDDTLSGGAGEDTLSGGPGDDTFVFMPDGGDDTITDFTDGDDTIDLSALVDITSFGNLSMEQQGDDVFMDLSGQGGGSILLEDFDIANLDALDFIL